MSIRKSSYLDQRPKALAVEAVSFLRSCFENAQSCTEIAAIEHAELVLGISFQSQGYVDAKLLELFEYWRNPYLNRPAEEVSSNWSEETFRALHERTLCELETCAIPLDEAQRARVEITLTACHRAAGHGSDSPEFARGEIHDAASRVVLGLLRKVLKLSASSDHP
ncbi:hypothetical protein [Myxococcus qinghaiensis]|uniref:hypothetical protein n=1 Tax=Myxococcus qinghaiensis TaxID=2906758 RepID=UPI0020A7FEF8|nr:hypothetical protein [Myxococcus qinghaiensis]MCP3165996.1 hypothetical protein [Myxococcus qinghaiensis]